MKKVVLLAAAIVMGMTISNAQEPVKKEVKAAPAKVECQHKCNHQCTKGQAVKAEGQAQKAEAQKAEAKPCCEKQAAKTNQPEAKKCKKALQVNPNATKELKAQPAEKKVATKK